MGHLKTLGPDQNPGKCYNCLAYQRNQRAFLRYYCAWCAGHTHESGKMPQLRAIELAEKTGKIPCPSRQKNIKWAGSFYNCIMSGNGVGTVWLRLPSLYKWSNLDIWVIGWLSECRDVGCGIMPVAPVSGYNTRWMNEFPFIASVQSLWACAPNKQHSSIHDESNSNKDWLAHPHTKTGHTYSNTRKQKQIKI